MQATPVSPEVYESLWARLNARWRRIDAEEGLGAVLRDLEQRLRADGFVQFDAEAVERHRFDDDTGSGAFFRVQYSPRRAERIRGPGTESPPAGVVAVNDGCHLCRANIRWQQRGTEFGYDLTVGSNDYVVWMNPYPLMPLNTVVAANDHLPQGSFFSDGDPAHRGVERLLSNMVELAGRLPGFVGLYNGVNAGATIPEHVHFQFFKPPAGYGAFPLERAASRATPGRGRPIAGYPITALHWSGDSDSVAAAASESIGVWLDRSGNGAATMSANLFAVRDPGSDDVDVYFVPRDQERSHAPGMSGAIGAIEVLGELVMTDPEEKERLERGELSYSKIERILAAVSVPWDLQASDA